jgi:hypothetical protein
VRRYSWDEGATWGQVVLAAQPLTVVNIVTEPRAASQQFGA